MKRDTIILIAFCLAGFVAVALQGIQFINKPLEHKEPLEGFTAVTRASDCNCLPGYIPSNKSGGEYDGNILVGEQGPPVYNPNNTNDIYMIDPANMCNLLPGVKDFDMRTTNDMDNYYKFVAFRNNILAKSKPIDFNLYRYRGTLTCDIIKQKTMATDNYFCQHLTDPSKTRKCY